MSVHNVHLDSWSEFKTKMTKDTRHNASTQRGYVYRGCANANWKLDSTLDRKYSFLSEAKRSAMSEALAEAFIPLAEDLGLAKGSALSDVLSLGQHNGLPTRLLDWTKSPYIAAYFAFATLLSDIGDSRVVGASRSIAIWRLDLDDDRFARRRDIKAPDVEVHEADRHLTPRLFAQRGLFTINHAGGDLAAVLAGSACLARYILPTAEARDALADLDAMGINDATMFPDMTGAARLAVTQVALGKGETP